MLVFTRVPTCTVVSVTGVDTLASYKFHEPPPVCYAHPSCKLIGVWTNRPTAQHDYEIGDGGGGDKDGGGNRGIDGGDGIHDVGDGGVTSLIPSVHGCLKSSIYYRSKVRTRSHVFAPGEYQPRQWEHTAEASGPLDVRDFQHTVPSKRLVRVTSPHIVFDSEEARWMTKFPSHLIQLKRETI
ncbi:unnamed protein product [Echinostoma caproni]|uniref:Uncharacterized protein n=1 Tax=Echinostoma caproni TaxID=27848 RepID=A0A183A606_9TREM|nr:unnamed protein product [Echinostoma caproni]